ncbi:MAG: HNH endonuclease, partial [Burkholderiales bacterium]
KYRWAVLKRDNYRCAKCGASPASDHSVELEVDHIIPVARGGSNDLANLQSLCQKCNQGKKARQ